MRVLCGYNANIDAVYKIRGAEVETLLESADLSMVTLKLRNPTGVIYLLEDFLAGLLLCMENGRGGEWFVHSPEVAAFLRERFLPESMIRMGGNMGIMSNVLSTLGADLVVPNVVSLSERQKQLFVSGTILLPESTGSASNAENEPLHFVFDFRKGDSFSFNGKKITVPRENRFIASFDEVNPQMEISPEFSEYAKRHIMEMDGAIISGFHMLQSSYPDGSTYEDRLKIVLQQLEGWKQGNESLPIHAELGHFMSVQIAVTVFRELAGVVNSIGLNEDELADLVEELNSSIPAIREMNMQSLLEAACVCMNISPVLSTLIVHTRDIVLSVSRDEKQVLSCIESLDFGIRAAATFALTGKLDSRTYVEEISSSMKRSVHGQKELDDVWHLIEGVEEYSGVHGTYKGYTICAIPTLIADDPVATVGLGDTFSAASFLRFLELHG